MEQFFLNYLKTFYTYSKYFECHEARCGWFSFDRGRALPQTIITALALIEHIDLDENRVIYWYEPKFKMRDEKQTVG